jgi:hypothetical protein
MTLTDEQLRELLTLPHELPHVEFKGPGLRADNPLFGRVVRAAIGMAIGLAGVWSFSEWKKRRAVSLPLD